MEDFGMGLDAPQYEYESRFYKGRQALTKLVSSSNVSYMYTTMYIVGVIIVLFLMFRYCSKKNNGKNRLRRDYLV